MTDAEIDAYYEALWQGYRAAFPDPPDTDDWPFADVTEPEGDSAPDTEHDEECPCERCREEREYIGELWDLGLIP